MARAVSLLATSTLAAVLVVAGAARALADDFAWSAQSPRFPEVSTAEWVTGAGLLAYSVATMVARERPFTDECRNDPDYDAGCGNPGSENASFFSGHATAAFAGAGVTCAHHAYLPIYGGGAPDAIACGVAVAMASAVSVLRVSTDNHYLSDVLVGSMVGFGLGYGLPYLLHYQHGHAAPAITLMPLMDRDHVGLAVRF